MLHEHSRWLPACSSTWYDTTMLRDSPLSHGALQEPAGRGGGTPRTLGGNTPGAQPGGGSGYMGDQNTYGGLLQQRYGQVGAVLFSYRMSCQIF